jgi:FkbM family methyltransferase
VGSRGSVYAFEPHPRIFAELKNNVARCAPDSADVRLFNCALGESSGYAQLLEPDHFDRNEGTAKLAPNDAVAGNKHRVRLDRLDALCDLPRIALLKLDVEGAETAVLAGAERLLANRRIENVIYEAHDCERSELHEMLQRRGFAIFGLGYGLRGLKVTPGTGAPRIDHAWESPSYLATLDSARTLPRLAGMGWRVLRGRR